MDRLPSRVYSVSSVRAADRWAIERLGLSGRVLMARAAAAAFETLRCHWPRVGRILVLCGPGNNGGDGYVLAALAAAEGYPVVVVAPAGLPSEGDAQAAHADWQRAGGVLTNWRLVRSQLK